MTGVGFDVRNAHPDALSTTNARSGANLTIPQPKSENAAGSTFACDQRLLKFGSEALKNEWHGSPDP